MKKSFVARMIASSAAHSVLTSSPISESVKQNGNNHDGANRIFHIGQALPVRSSFRFNQDQKIFLFKVFKAGEKTGYKSSPEEVHQLMRNSFLHKIIALLRKFDLCFQDMQDKSGNQVY